MLLALLSVVVLINIFSVQATSASPSLKTDQLAATALYNLGRHVIDPTSPPSGCSFGMASVRQEWGAMSKSARRAYTSAVQCLAKKPSRISKNICPGCLSRYDDFVATHMNQTYTIHATGNFLSWHRYFTWTYERALQTECGYTSTQPYWNWPKYSDNPLRSPIFDGSDTSMSGNGVYSEHPPIYVPLPELPYITIPPAQGGGCISSGPFKNFTVHLGPISPGYANLSTNPRADGLGLNSRCIRRDINPWVSTRGSTDRNVSWLIETHDDILSFQNDMQGDFPNGLLGVHTAGHMTVNGDPGGDFSVSPGDPIFFLHHAMIDRVWWTWQNLNITARTYAVAGTYTLYNSPPSANTTLDDLLDLGYVAKPITIREAMSTITGSKFCYVYE